MELFLKYFFHIFHGIAGFFGILLNLILLYVSITKSPSTIKTYSFLIVNFGITDLAAAILSVFIEQRVIPIDRTLVHVSYGPCIYFGPQYCYAGYSMMLHFFMHSQWCLLLSFCYRLFVLKNSTPKARRLFGVIFLVYIPSFIQFVSKEQFIARGLN
ncbi:unnamed protein product [Caenorhabditis angaria]|uniref:G-protein coupled receptors family 1 profile domain-containing protein n=1 Tax=Caenorhabditis angaria TaxID=860376 RepID=A0A9P1IWJ8_9PELO|nr:unnamed protein product [Caenorhabditis angaria]